MSMTDLYKQTKEYAEGRAACADGWRRAANPYTSGEQKGNATAWWCGWDYEDSLFQEENEIFPVQGEDYDTDVCPHCRKDLEDFSDLGCEQCDTRHPLYGIS